MHNERRRRNQSSSMGYRTSEQQIASSGHDRVPLSETEEIFFACLFIQAQDSAAARPVLGDPYAQQYINKADLDLTKSIFTTDPRTVQTLVRRRKLHDEWLQRFLDQHAVSQTPVTVVYLGCGLDSRSLRVNRGPSVRWLDVDSHEAINLRKKIIPTPPGDYHLLTAAIGGSDHGWLDNVPADRPTYIIAEELLMWLKPRDGKALIQGLIEYFPLGGQLATDVIGSLIKELSWLMPLMKGTKVKFNWAVNDCEREIESLHRRLKLRKTVRWYELLGSREAHDDEGKPATPFFGRWTGVASYIPGFKSCAQVVLFDFGVMPLSRSTVETAVTDSSGGSSKKSIGAFSLASSTSGMTESSHTGVSYKGSMLAGSTVEGGVAYGNQPRTRDGNWI